MGDRCYFQMTAAKGDVEKINEVIFNGDSDCWEEVIDNEEGTVTLIDYEANYGHFNQLMKLAEAGIVFEGFHHSGGEYDGCEFACYDGKYAAVNAVEGGPIVLVGRSGVDKTGLKHVKEYYATYDFVEKYFRENC